MTTNNFDPLYEEILKKKLARITLPARISELKDQLRAAEEELAKLGPELARLEKLYEYKQAVRAWEEFWSSSGR